MGLNDKNDKPKGKVVAHILPKTKKEAQSKQLLDWLEGLPPGGKLTIMIPDD